MYYTSDIDCLNKLYNRKTSDIAILYGNKRAGLFDTLQEFLKNKLYFYYKASRTERECQNQLFIKELNNQSTGPKYISADYEKILKNYLSDSNEKKIIIFDDFSNLLYYDSTFLNFLLSLTGEQNKAGSVMVLLCSNNVNWIENEMLNSLGDKSYDFSAIIKISDTDFGAYVNHFKEVPVNELFCVFCILGGSSKLWNRYNVSKSFKQNLTDEILIDKDLIISESETILPKDLRQTSVYNTILYYIACGYHKLNDLFKVTGIERAKISVYLKTLILHRIIYKEDSAEIGNKINYSKAIYKICDPFVNFWYTYIFPNYSSFLLINTDKFVKRFIEPSLETYIESYYPLLAKYLLTELCDKNKLPFKITDIKPYNDKNQIIDFIAYTSDDEVLVCSCNPAATHFSYKSYEQLIYNIKKNNINYDKILLFSSSGYDQKLSFSSHIEKNIFIFENKEFYIHSILQK